MTDSAATMGDDWWPDLLRYVGEEQPWALPQIVVAELHSYPDDPGLPGSRTLWSALVKLDDLESLGGKLGGFNYDVETAGPGPGPLAVGVYTPEFWISAIDGDRRIKCEPLVLSWQRNNRTAMVIEPGFLMTYGLVPRGMEDGSVHWDDPAEPEFDIAVVDPPSIYEDSAHGGARVIIARDHLQDYLTLRGMALVQVYHEARRGLRDAAIEAMLGAEDRRTAQLRDREIDIQRGRDRGYFAQIWGARVIALPGPLPVTVDPLETEGVVWPGIDGGVTNDVARRFRTWDHVYVRDTVHAAYEGQPGFSIHPESGGVHFGHQWSVGPADRVGRDVIRVEIRKLYEGAPRRAIQHWREHAVAPTPDLLTPEARAAPNVGRRSRALVYGLARIGLHLSEMAELFDLDGVRSADFVGLDGPDLDYQGWWNGPHVEPVTRHIARDMERGAFLSRCLMLDKLLVESLAQRHLRALLRAIGVPAEDIREFRGLKLLDRLVCLVQVGVDAGLRIWEYGPEIVARMTSDGTRPERPLDRLFALSDLRQLAGHRKDDLEAHLADALRRFGLAAGAAAGGWGLVLDELYDQLAAQLLEVDQTLVTALQT